MSKSFRELREQSIRIQKNPLVRRANSLASPRRPRRRIRRRLYHGPRGLGSRTAGSTMRFQRQNVSRPIPRPINPAMRRLEEVLGALALGAAAGALAYRTATKPGGVVDRVQREKMRKDRLKMAIKNSEDRLRILKDKLNKSSSIKAALSKKFANRPFEESYKNISPRRKAQLIKTSGEVAHQKIYGNKHPYFGPKSRQQERIMSKINARLKEEAVAMNTGQTVAPGKQAFAGLPPDQPVVRKPMTTLRRKKPV